MNRLLVGFSLALGVFFVSQATSQAVVGYINRIFYPGDNLITIQLDNGENHLSELFAGAVPEGTKVALWDAGSLSYIPEATYYDLWGWVHEGDLAPNDFQIPRGIGARLTLSIGSQITNTFVGEILASDIGIPHPDPGPGTYLFGATSPLAGVGFEDVLGRAPLLGESVVTLDPVSQIYTTNTFVGVWSDGDPSLEVMDAAFFNLVPEPTTVSILALGSLALATWRRRR